MIYKFIGKDFMIHPRRELSDGSRRKAVFFDLDGTLWDDQGPGTLLEVDMKKLTSREAIISMSGEWLRIGISNQTLFCYSKKGAFIKYFKYRKKMRLLLKNGILDGIFACHHHPNSNVSELRFDCPNRKPKSGFIEYCLDELKIDPSKSALIGDRITDIIAAESASISNRFLLSSQNSFNQNSHQLSLRPAYSFHVAHSLKDALNACDLEVS